MHRCKVTTVEFSNLDFPNLRQGFLGFPNPLVIPVTQERMVPDTGNSDRWSDRRTAALRCQCVAMMQAAESPGRTYRASHCGTARGRPARWRILRQSQMCSICMVIADVLAHESIQMPFVQYDHCDQASLGSSFPHNAPPRRSAMGCDRRRGRAYFPSP